MADDTGRQRQGAAPGATYDRWSRPQALSNRGYLLAVLVPILVAAIAFGVVSLVSAGDETASGTTVRLATSGWHEGDEGGDAAIQGVLRVDDDQCAYLEAGQDGADPGRVYVVWPSGFHARLDRGRMTLYDADGTAIAQDGDVVSAGGSYAPSGSFTGEPCLPDRGEVATVQSDVTVTH